MGYLDPLKNIKINRTRNPIVFGDYKESGFAFSQPDTSTPVSHLFFRGLYSNADSAMVETLAKAQLQPKRKKQWRRGYKARRL